MSVYLPKAFSKYGADMGRSQMHSEAAAYGAIDRTDRKFRLNAIRLNQGGYDSGGAYWGAVPSLTLYQAADESGDVCVYYRARSREQCKALIRERYPNARFFR